MRLLVVYRHYQRVPFHQEFVYRTQCSVGWHSWTLHYLVARNERAKLTHSLTLSNESYPDLPLACYHMFSAERSRYILHHFGACAALMRSDGSRPVGGRAVLYRYDRRFSSCLELWNSKLYPRRSYHTVCSSFNQLLKLLSLESW